MRAATAKVTVPAAGGRLAQCLCGFGEDGAHLWQKPGLAGWIKRDVNVRLAGQLGFADAHTYFNDDFLAGAKDAMRHLADQVVPSMRASVWDEAADSKGGGVGGNSVVQAALRAHLAEAMTSLKTVELEIRWDVEAVTLAALGHMMLTVGARRTGLPQDGFRVPAAFGHTVVLTGDRKPSAVSPLDCLAAAAHRGATLSVDALLKAKQTVIIKRPGKDGEILTASFDEGARHVLRLEADLVAPRPGIGADATGHEFWENRPVFNEDRGWLVSDINFVLNGNQIAEKLPLAGPE